jgi:hypothetical protein
MHAMRIRSYLRPIAKWTGTLAVILILLTLVASQWYALCWHETRLVLFAHAPVRAGWERHLGFGIDSGEAFFGWTADWRHPLPFAPTGVSVNRIPYSPDRFALWLSSFFRLPEARWTATTSTRSVHVPLWTPLLCFIVPTLWLWHRDRYNKPGHCQRCRYDLTGNTSGVCPECGARARCLP